LRRHPWIFESAIAKGGADAGETVRVESHAGQFLAWAAFSPASKIRARAWSFDEAQRIDAARLVHGESDGLPGLIVDRYGDTLVAQFTSAGMERWKDVIADALLAATGKTALYERSDASSRALEGLPEATGWLRGDGPLELILREHDWQLAINIATGHKTGFYLDQRDSVLNCYCYTGGFTVAALTGGAAHVTSIDSSGPALEKAAANVALNGFDASRATFMDADVNASMPSCSIRRSLPPLRRMPSARRVPTKTSIGWPSRSWRRAGFCSPTPVQAASALTCFIKSWPPPASTRRWMVTSASAWAAPRITR